MSFTGLEDGAWYLGAVTWACHRSLMIRYGNVLFRPHGALSQTQLSQILYNPRSQSAVSRSATRTQAAAIPIRRCKNADQ